MLGNSMEYLCITSKDNYYICKSYNIWGVKDKEEFGNSRNENIIKNVNPGDLLLFYLKTPVSKVVALYETKSRAFNDSNHIWVDGIYALRIKIELKETINKISYSTLMNRQLRILNDDILHDKQQLRREMIPLEKGSVEKLLKGF